MKIMIATPMYGGNSKSVYVACLTNLTQKLSEAGHTATHTSITNESLITRARNTLTHMFMASDHDALLFIDSDHGFVSEDIIRMIESGEDVIGAIYPMKSINWDNVQKAAIAGVPVEDLHLYSGNFAVNFLPDSQTFRGDEPFKVRDVGTGMLFISRKVFEQMKSVCKVYKNNSPGEIPIGEEIVEYFPTIITEEPESILLSEDYAFCHLWRSIGGTVHAAPWVRISHAGEYNFTGNFLKTLEIQNQVIDEEEEKAPAETTPPAEEPKEKKKK